MRLPARFQQAQTTARHDNRGTMLHLERLEPRRVLSTTPLITEFMASNNATILDGDGNSSDWIEINNPTTAAIDLAGWHLTDDASNLNKWPFPDREQSILDPGEFLIVFASGQATETYIDPSGYLHTDFKLSASGEYLALTDPAESVVHEFAPEYPAQSEDISFGLGASVSTETLVDESSSLSYLVPADGSLGTNWTQPNFDDATWTSDTAGIGYENRPGDQVNYSSLIDTPIPSGTTSLYTRFEFQVANPSQLHSLTLRIMYDDGFVAYLNGELIASGFAPDTPLWNSTASDQRSDSVVIEDFVDFNISSHLDNLAVGNNVLAIHSLNFSSSSSDMLMITELIGTTGTIIEPLQTGFFSNPSPNAPNGEVFEGTVADTQFSHDRGLYNAAFDLAITSATPGAKIVYTTDGSVPTVDANLSVVNGIEYIAPLNIAATTTLRAAGFKQNFLPTNVDTHTYLFLSDVLTQSPTGAAPSGFPSSPVNGQQFDYGMDPNIVNDPNWGPQLNQALTEIPSISLVTDTDHLFDANSGIYVNAQNRGRAWERLTSIELINGDGSTGFQTDAGLRIRGGFSRGDFNPKHSFRLFFRNDYGDGKLDFPLFGEEGVDRFDAFDLRTAQNYAWSNDTFNNENRNTFLRDVYSRDLGRAQGRAYTRSAYYHLYLNGQYWGMYQTEERPEADYAASYYGGTDDDWDAVKASGSVIEATDGDLAAWQTLTELVNAGFTSDTAYYAIQGLNIDGSDNPTLEKHLDIDNLIDFMIAVNFTANRDMPLNLNNSGPNNFWAIRQRDGNHGWRWIAHDNEHAMGALDHNVNHDGTGDISVGTSPGSLNPRYIHQRLSEHAEYRLRFADRVQTLFFNDGPLTTENAQALLDARSDQITQAIIAESARWGDQHNEPPKTQATWQTEVDWLRNTFLAQRGAIVLQQFRNRGWLPDSDHDAPMFSQHGGILPAGQSLEILNQETAGTLYYTLDGSDPRLPGGAVRSTAEAYSGAFQLPDHATVSARLLREGVWSAMIQADFVLADGVADDTNLRVTEVHYNPAAPTASELGLGFTDNNQFELLELYNDSEITISLDGVTLAQTVVDDQLEGVSFEFGSVALAAGETILLVDDIAAFEARYGAGLNVAGPYSGRLNNGGETLTLRDAQGTTIQQFAFDDTWYSQTDGAGRSLEVLDTAGDYNSMSNWRASTDLDGTPGTVSFTSLAASDFDFDGDVDGHDFLAWQRGFGMPNATRTDGDSDNDNDVDATDLANWKAGYGSVSPALAALNGQGASLSDNHELESSYSELVDAAIALAVSSDLNEETELLLERSPILEQVDVAFADPLLLPAASPSDTNALAASLSKDEQTENQWLTDELLKLAFS